MQSVLYWFGKCLVLILQALPLEFVAGVGRAGGLIAHGLDGRHRRVARENLARAFPEKSAAQVRQLARENFQRLGENYVCAVKTAAMPVEAILARCEILGLEKLAPPPENLRQNRIVAIGHFGNFELYSAGPRAMPGYRAATTYRALPQPGFNRLMVELREASGCLCFERRTGGRALMAALKSDGLILGLFSDQHAGRKGVWAPFLGTECSTNPAAAVLALRYRLPLFTSIIFTTGPGRWRIEVGDQIPTHQNGEPRRVDEIMGDVNRVFEEAIRREPANWFWVHRRWKARPQAVTERAAAA